MEYITSNDNSVLDEGNNDECVTTDEYNLSGDILRDILPHMKKHVEEEKSVNYQ